MSAWAIPRVPKSDDLAGLMEIREGAIDRLTTLYFRLMGKITTAAEKVELVIGLRPLPEPPDEKEREKMIKEEALIKKVHNLVNQKRVETKGRISLSALSGCYYDLLKTNKKSRMPWHRE